MVEYLALHRKLADGQNIMYIRNA